MPALKLPSMVYKGDVEVVVHEAVGVAYPIEALADLAEEGEPLLAVSIVQIDRLSPVATRGNVVQSAGEFNAQGAGHGLMLQRLMLQCKT
ncbi:MAG: hypothetical protein Q7T46_01805 [Polaromonas sp.]|nr:hypothetical protein [Polaromonas sp.]